METIVPPPFRVTLDRLPTGGVVLRQTADADNLIVIPPEHLREAVLAMARCVQQLVDQ